MAGITVVIPVYNRRDLVTRALDSLLRQSRFPDSLVVVDNASTDDTQAVVAEWRERHRADFPEGFEMRILSEAKPGASAARNAGLRCVDTEYVYFFDSDDEMHPDLIAVAMARAEKTGADLVYWRGVVRSLNGSSVARPLYGGDLIRRQFYNCLLSTQCYLVKTSLVRDTGAWEENALGWNDWELGIRLSLASPRKEMLSDTLVTIHAQAESITGTGYAAKAEVWENTLDIVERKIEDTDRPDRRRLLDMVDYRRAILAAHYRREGARQAAARLLRRSLNRTGRSIVAKGWLHLLYQYTAAGGRAAYYLWRR